MSDVKLCKDCRHYRDIDGPARFWHEGQEPMMNVCVVPYEGPIDYVNGGSPMRTKRLAIEARTDHNPTACGPAAKFYEPKTEEGK